MRIEELAEGCTNKCLSQKFPYLDFVSTWVNLAYSPMEWTVTVHMWWLLFLFVWMFSSLASWGHRACNACGLILNNGIVVSFVRMWSRKYLYGHISEVNNFSFRRLWRAHVGESFTMRHWKVSSICIH
jgi:hypothetical protein